VKEGSLLMFHAEDVRRNGIAVGPTPLLPQAFEPGRADGRPLRIRGFEHQGECRPSPGGADRAF
jgi:hypothetical protein